MGNEGGSDVEVRVDMNDDSPLTRGTLITHGRSLERVAIVELPDERSPARRKPYDLSS
jgi:hypothetical protein